MSQERKNALLLGAIIVCATFIRFWGIQWGLPYEYQSEEHKIVKYALKMGAGDLNPHFFEYPSLYLYFTLFLYGIYFVTGRVVGLFADPHDFALSFVRDPSCFYLIGRTCEAIAGIVIVYLVYRIGKKMYSENAGLCAALVFAGLPQFVFMSHIIKGYMGMIALLLLFFLATLQIAERNDRRYYIFAGILLGLAVSTRYHAAPFGIALPLAHFYRLFLTGNARPKWDGKSIWEDHKYLILSLVLIPVFFFIGTPYALLSPGEFWKDVGGNIDIFSTLTGEKRSYIGGVLEAGKWFLYLGDVAAPLLLGIVCLAGSLYAFYRWESKHLLMIVPIVTYLLIVGGYHHPAGGYLLQAMPLFVVLGVHGLLSLPKAFLRGLAMTVFYAAAAWNLTLGTRFAYSFTVPDTRTIAKEWIEKNIPQGSTVLIDVKVQAPPLLMSYDQLEKFHRIAVELDHYKKEYFGLQLEVHPGPGSGYEIIHVKRSYREIASIAYQVDEVQKTQDLVEVSGDIDRLKRMGIEYAIVDRLIQEGAIKNNLTGIADYYRNLPENARLLITFEPEYDIFHGGTISIYKL